MPDQALPLRTQLVAVVADARETARMAREIQSRATERIAESEQAIKESREVMDRADASLRRLGASSHDGP